MTLAALCATLFIINALTIGGGYVMLPMLQEEFVQNHHWLTSQEFLDAIALGQITPGPLTVMNAFIGFKVSGLAGAILAMISSYLPSVLIVLLIAKFYYAYKSSQLITSSFKGITAAVIGLLVSVVITMGQGAFVDISTVIIAISSFIIIVNSKFDPTFVIIGAGAAGLLLF